MQPKRQRASAPVAEKDPAAHRIPTLLLRGVDDTIRQAERTLAIKKDVLVTFIKSINEVVSSFKGLANEEKQQLAASVGEAFAQLAQATLFGPGSPSPPPLDACFAPYFCTRDEILFFCYFCVCPGYCYRS